jgi:hypothetical protein
MYTEEFSNENEYEYCNIITVYKTVNTYQVVYVYIDDMYNSE